MEWKHQDVLNNESRSERMSLTESELKRAIKQHRKQHKNATYARGLIIYIHMLFICLFELYYSMKSVTF